MGEVVGSGLRELWAHKLRSLLTLTLLMLGVFALVVMTSLLGGIMDKITSGFRGMGWDGALVLRTRSPETAEEQKRFAQSPGLRMEDLPRLTVPGGRILAFLPRAVQEQDVRVAGGNERVFVTGNVPEYLPVMNRRIASGRGLTEDDQKRRSPVAVLGASLASRLLGGADPVIDHQASVAAFERLGSSDKTLRVYPPMLHEPLNEVGREEVFADVESWLRPRL